MQPKPLWYFEKTGSLTLLPSHPENGPLDALHFMQRQADAL